MLGEPVTLVMVKTGMGGGGKIVTEAVEIQPSEKVAVTVTTPGVT